MNKFILVRGQAERNWCSHDDRIWVSKVCQEITKSRNIGREL